MLAPDGTGRGGPFRSPALNDRDLLRLCRIIRESCGMKMNANKRMLLQNWLGRRLRALGFEGFSHYCRYLETTEGARKEQIHLWSAITTNQTHFFREPHHFHTLCNYVLPAMATQRTITKTVRIWSAGCSTGQEPYTLAMILDEWCANHPGWSYRIIATDIDRQALSIAERGVYPASLRQEIGTKQYLRHCKSDGNCFEVAPGLRKKLVFRHQNLATALPLNPKVDIIFCRNVTMYLDPDVRARLANVFKDSLMENGVVVLGSSENFRRNQHPFVTERHGKTTLYRKPPSGRSPDVVV